MCERMNHCILAGLGDGTSRKQAIRSRPLIALVAVAPPTGTNASTRPGSSGHGARRHASRLVTGHTFRLEPATRTKGLATVTWRGTHL